MTQEMLADQVHPYPRLCAHRGFCTAAPENSLPAFEAAVALGADEIEFDLWETADGEIVSTHDETLDRISTGTGTVFSHTYEELLQYDFGIRFGEAYRGLRILRFEEILQHLGRRVIMNIHIKEPDLTAPLPEPYLKKMVALIRAYGCEDYVYLMCNETVQRQLMELAPQIRRCCGGGGTVERRRQIVERAIQLGSQKLQFHRDYMTREMIEKAHAHGIVCNVFWTDDPAEAAEFYRMGVDTVLTNDFGALCHVKNQAASGSL